MTPNEGGVGKISPEVLAERMTSLAQAMEKLEDKISNKLVTKDQLNLQISAAMQVLHKDIIDPMQKKIAANEIKANWALRFVIVTLSSVGLAVLGAVLKTNLGI